MTDTFNYYELQKIKIALEFTRKMTDADAQLSELIEKTERLIEEKKGDEQD